MLGGPSRDRAEFPSLIEDIGEDPARYLDRDVSVKELAPIIRGMDHIDRIRAWKAVERAIDRGPRSDIIDALERREEVLEEIGERPDRSQPREVAFVPPVQADYPDRPDIDEASDREVFSSERAFGPLRERYPHLFDEEQTEAAEDGESETIATDGGEA